MTLAEEQVGPTRLTVEWSTGARLEDMALSLQRQGHKTLAGTGSLGWAGPLETYRPLLTYDELGALFAMEPSKLYDALSTVLGLDQVTNAVRRLEVRSKALAAAGVELTRTGKQLVQELIGADDERAERACALVSARNLDSAALRALATGTAPEEDGTGARLRMVMQLSVPGRETTGPAAMRLTAAVGAVAREGERATASLERRADVVRAALTVHSHDGDMPCPVCAVGTLDEARAARLREELERSDNELRSLHGARRELDAARAHARSLLAPVPFALTTPLPDGLESLRLVARETWSSWSEAPEDDLRLADHIAGGAGPLLAALTALRSSAESALAARDDAWSPVAARLAAYADDADRWAAEKPRSDAAKAALKWLKDSEAALKNERMQPIAKQAAEIWADLRQESNVDIAGVRLEGTATRRRVTIAASVDGQDAGLSVMSQGELHALALALFLPRATMPESPFRFVVLDDPVQAMDPAKVDGLVSVLSHIARRRQVVVFSHDDRLASAVRRAAVDATIVEVVREASSKVTVRSTFDPARRYLRDAFAMVRDEGLPEGTLRRLVPGLLRLAVEAAARDRYFADALSRGATHAEVERQWTGTHRTSPRVALALYGEVKPLDAWLDKAGYRARGLGICTGAVHTGLKGDPRTACGDVERMVDDVKGGPQ